MLQMCDMNCELCNANEKMCFKCHDGFTLDAIRGVCLEAN
jgi:hypothetical protein